MAPRKKGFAGPTKMLRDLISIESILSLNKTAATETNPFIVVYNVVRSDLTGFSVQQGPKRTPYLAFLGVNGFVLLAAIFAFWLRLSTRERWFYRIQETPWGRVIVPNAILNYLAWDVVYCIFVTPFVLYGCYRLGGSIEHFLLWKMSVMIPLFMGVWNVTYSFMLSTHLNSLADGWSVIALPINAWVANTVFILPQVVFPVALILTTVLNNERFKHGWRAYVIFADTLLQHSGQFPADQIPDVTNPLNLVKVIQPNPGQFTLPDVSSAAELIRESIPNIDVLMANTVTYLYGFMPYYQVCSSMMLFCAILMGITSILQATMIVQQLRESERAMSRNHTLYLKDSLEECNSTVGSEGYEASIATLKKRLGIILIVCLLIFASSFTYFVGCHLSVMRAKYTPLFHINKTETLHLKLMLFGYTSFNLAAVVFIIIQTMYNRPAPISKPTAPVFLKSFDETQ